MTFQPPVADIAFCLRHVADMAGLERLFPEATGDTVDAVLAEAARFAGERIAPLNRLGDTAPPRFEAGRVSMPPGWREAYADWSAAGWNGLAAPPAFGGQGLPLLLNSACLEMWNAASMAFGIGPVLTMGAIEALAVHGSAALKATYLPRLVSGEWMGTMNLTEPQAGSDLGALRARAERAGDGSYRIFGQKIFITYGEHDLTGNIVHLVLARLPDGPPGTRGLSLFLVPQRLVGPDGAPGARNDVACASIEHKLGIHGSPTCTMVFGETGSAIGHLVGEEHRGLACMFTMMNNARLAVGLQGVGIAERAYQQALAYAKERRQGRASGWTGDGMSPIVRHPDVRRMLLEMRAKTAAARGLCYQVAEAIDRSHHEPDEAARRRAQERASLLTPIAKAFSTDIGSEVASLGLQVHGGAGYIEETGAAQHLRDARIAAIYEGTNGIQAIDLVTRKLPLDEGRAVAACLAELRGHLAGDAPAASGSNLPPLHAALDALERATAWMQQALAAKPADALAGATPYLRLFALAAGGVSLAREARAAAAARAGGDGDPAHRLRIDAARFFAGQVASAADGLAASVMQGEAALGDAFEDAA